MGHGHAHGGGHGHSHGGGIPSGSAAARNKGRLAWALGLTLTYMFAEVVGGLLTGSLALLADAAHMVTDAGGLALALLAIHYAAKAPTAGKSFGYMRFEIPRRPTATPSRPSSARPWPGAAPASSPWNATRPAIPARRSSGCAA